MIKMYLRKKSEEEWFINDSKPFDRKDFANL